MSYSIGYIRVGGGGILPWMGKVCSSVEYPCGTICTSLMSGGGGGGGGTFRKVYPPTPVLEISGRANIYVHVYPGIDSAIMPASVPSQKLETIEDQYLIAKRAACKVAAENNANVLLVLP